MNSAQTLIAVAEGLNTATETNHTLHVWRDREMTEGQKRRWAQSFAGSPPNIFREAKNAFLKKLRGMSNAQLEAETNAAFRSLSEEAREAAFWPENRSDRIAFVADCFDSVWKANFESATGVKFDDTLDLDKYRAGLLRRNAGVIEPVVSKMVSEAEFDQALKSLDEDA